MRRALAAAHVTARRVAQCRFSKDAISSLLRIRLYHRAQSLALPARLTSTTAVCAGLPSLTPFCLGSLLVASFHVASATNAARNWRAESRGKLSDFEANVIWDKGTEPPRSGAYDKFYPTEGYFACKVCGTPLYSAASKFDSGCGWPAFDRCYAGSVKTEIDSAYGMRRVEITCGNCGGHLGHVFEGERFTATNERHCVNSASVRYVKDAPPMGLKEAKVV